MNKRRTGFLYERRAAAHLEALGYRILEQNYQCRMGEIDLIAEKDGYLIFVEVKYRRDSSKGSPFEAVDKRKQTRIARTAGWYLTDKGYPLEQPCRFDVVGITGASIEVLADAFRL